MPRRYVLRAETAPAPALTLDYAGALDPQQLAAATAPPGATLVVAGAGTGKTRTLVHRLAWLVETGTPPESVVLLTFSRRAAREMLARAEALLDGRLARVRGGTFHAVCAALLREHAERAGLPPGFTILDAPDAADVLDLLRARAGLDRSGLRFPAAGRVQAILSAAVNRGQSVAGVLETDFPRFLPHAEALEDLARTAAAYKREAGLVDYDDLLALALRLFDEHDDVARAVAGRTRHVLVDEVQDVNRMQIEIVERLASVHGNVTAVGDDAQAIYGFRGGSVQHMLGFERRFAGARVLRLERNYRSVQPVLDVANRVLAGVTEGFARTLVAHRPGGEPPALVRAPDDVWEARFVAQVVLDAHEEGTPLARMAVLMRAGWCSYTLETELARRGIPFVKVGGIRLAEAAHVKDLAALLRAAENPADAVAWTRALRLAEGVGPRLAQRLLGWAAAAVATPPPGELPALPAGVPRAAAVGVYALAGAVRDLRHGADLPVAEQFARAAAAYRPLLERLYDDADERAADLDALAALAARQPTRAAFLEALALDPLDAAAAGVDPALPDEAPLVLSTVHSAKGLEFERVFLIHALDGILPSAYAVGRPEEMDEERRLLYVALTRAERELYVSVPLVQHRRGGQALTDPSRFLTELPPELLDPWTLAEEAPDVPALPPASPPALPPALPPPALPPAALRPRA